jgi:hypothetical protein
MIAVVFQKFDNLKLEGRPSAFSRYQLSPDPCKFVSDYPHYIQ